MADTGTNIRNLTTSHWRRWLGKGKPLRRPRRVVLRVRGHEAAQDADVVRLEQAPSSPSREDDVRSIEFPGGRNEGRVGRVQTLFGRIMDFVLTSDRRNQQRRTTKHADPHCASHLINEKVAWQAAGAMCSLYSVTSSNRPFATYSA
jgi:hypothetical protein